VFEVLPHDEQAEHFEHPIPTAGNGFAARKPLEEDIERHRQTVPCTATEMRASAALIAVVPN
jgi:hypothetical protein